MTPVAAAPSLPASSRRWAILALLVALCFISHFNRASITSAGDERIIKQFGLSPERMGFVYSSFLVVYTLFMIPGGWIIDRYGPRLALAGMALGSAVFCAFTGGVGFGFIPPALIWVSLLMVRSLMGLFSTPLHPATARCLGGWFDPGSQALANGITTGASILAYAVVHPVFGALIDRLDWPVSFMILGVLTGGLAFLWFFVARDRPVLLPEPVEQVPEASVSPAVVSSVLPRQLVLLTLSYAAVGYFQYLFFYWLHYYFDTILHMDKVSSRYYAGLPNLAMAAAMPVGGWLTDFLDKRLGVARGRTLIPKVGMILSALLLASGTFAVDRFWIVLLFTLALGVLGLCESAFWTTAVQAGGTRGGTAAAIMNTGGNGIGLLAPVLTPYIGERIGWGWGLGLGAAVAVLGALCWFGIHPGASVAPRSLDKVRGTA